MDRYEEIRRRATETAKAEGARLLAVIGSSVRSDTPADEYSDLDLLLVTDAPEGWLYGELPARFGDMKLSFVEPTLGGARERRMLFEGYLDVDLIVMTGEQFQQTAASGEVGMVANRGYRVLYDAGNNGRLLETTGDASPAASSGMEEAEFSNLVNDFFFHTVWAAKKLRRGELWTAKMCVDAYLKGLLLKMIEWNALVRKERDVWHNGRFLDVWVDPDVREELRACFARYDPDDVKKALTATEALFARLARETAESAGYVFPAEGESCARAFLQQEP